MQAPIPGPSLGRVSVLGLFLYSAAPLAAVPAYIGPAATASAVTAPAVTAPAVTAPAVTAPAVTAPAVTAPAAIGTAVMAGVSDTAAARGAAVHVLELKGAYLEHPDPNALDPAALLSGTPTSPKSFFKLCDYVDELAANEEVHEVLLDLGAPELAMNGVQVSELTRRLTRLRAAGKETWAWIESGGPVHYALAAACDHVVMGDMGVLDLPAVSLGSLHFKDAFDLLGIEASSTRVGEYKGATEPFTESHMSDHLRAHYHAMLTSMNDEFVARIAFARQLSTEAVRQLQTQRVIRADEALAAGLVDALAPLGGGRARIEELRGSATEWVEREKKGPRSMSFFELMGELMGTKKAGRLREPGFAVLHLEGMIVDGSTRSPGSMVSGPTVEEIDDLRTDEKVRGVVVRIDSGGGSATASEAIRQALARLAAEKPLVYSMGSVAASGGYWISCTGEPILVEPQTITGSIGVLALKLDFGGLLDRVGLHMDQVELDESASMMSPTRGWTDAERARIQAFCDDIYARFIALVAASRGKTTDEIDAIGGGRVWSGLQAIERGLVDRVGGVGDALAMVRAETDLAADAPVVHRPAHPSPLQALAQMGSGEEIRFSLALELAERAGFRLRAARAIAEASFGARTPSVWLLGPSELVVR